MASISYDLSKPAFFPEDDREEVLCVWYDGIIKNTTEAILRVMGRDEEEWVEEYPGIEAYSEMDRKELYVQTFMIPIMEAMVGLSNGKKSEDEILKDLAFLEPQILPSRLTMTTFEYSLHNLLSERKVKACYIYKDRPFYKNEIIYLQNRFGNVFDKIHLVAEVDFASLVAEVGATSIFLVDPSFVFDHVETHMSQDEQMGKLFVFLNSIYNMNVGLDEKGVISKFAYRQAFLDKVEKVNRDGNLPYGIATMFNYPIDTR